MVENDISVLKELRIGIPLYEGFDSLDVAGPNQVFFFLKNFAKELGKEISIYMIGPQVGDISSFDGLTWNVSYDFCSDLELDMIFVPGATDSALVNVLEKGLNSEEDNYLNFLKKQVQIAEVNQRPHIVSAVCTGAILLAAAGLLQGYRCTTHWAFQEPLRLFDQVYVEPGYPRYVIDRNRITGGGISSGIDEALAIAAVIAGDEIARKIQLLIQYAPNPPFHEGDPSHASPDILYKVSNTANAGEVYQAVQKFMGT
ncbi:MAG: DJ-1/PfpI family protein [Bacteroidia bacterium]|nr:DJ-1/PfpI family protein [Bacteroidia bacterium]